MKYFIYISILLLIQSCASIKPTNDLLVIEKEIIKDTTSVDTIFVEQVVKETLFMDGKTSEDKTSEDKTKTNETESVVNSKVNKVEEKVKVKLVDNTTTKDITNESVGIMAYSKPKQMVVGKSYTIKLRISKEKNKIQLISGDRNIPINDVNIDSKVFIESIRVEPIMSASLLSEEGKFLITPVSTETQNIENKGYTEWQWRITPLKGGYNFLKLVVKVRICNENGVFYKDITVFDKNIKVKSNFIFSIKNWISTHWQWLISTIFIPLIVWFYKKKKKEKI
jgi:hypothetical protein